MYDRVDEYDGYTISFKELPKHDPRLGRNVKHDSRSLSYQVEPVDDISTLASIRHEEHIPVLDQGNLGSCTGNAGTGNLGSGVFWDPNQVYLSATDASADETYAVALYSAATQVDDYQGSYPPEDTGSDGLSVAKVLNGRGQISGYRHATSFEAVLTALASQPVIVGTEWLTQMFDPEGDGRLIASGKVEGGHEYLLDELDVENQRIWMRNSWGLGWGIEGRAYFTYEDFKRLLTQQGDCTVFVPANQPAPTPVPPQPEPTPTPDPNQPSDFERLVEDLKIALDKLVAWFKSN